MFGLSFTHLIILAVLMLVFIGPEQLPEVARTIARLLNEWRRTSSELTSSLTNTLKDDLERRPPPTAPQAGPVGDAAPKAIETPSPAVAEEKKS